MFGFNFGSGLIGSFFTSMGEIFSKHAVSAMEKKVPGFMNWSDADEQIFISLRAKLKPEEGEHLTDFLMLCTERERSKLRGVVGGCEEVEEKITTPDPKNPKESITVVSKKRDDAVSFLREIARLTKEKGAPEARRLCLSGGVILQNPLHKRMLKLWRKGVKSTKKFKKFLDDGGVEKILDDHGCKRLLTRLGYGGSFGDDSVCLEEPVARIATVLERSRNKRKKRSFIFWLLFGGK